MTVASVMVVLGQREVVQLETPKKARSCRAGCTCVKYRLAPSLQEGQIVLLWTTCLTSRAKIASSAGTALVSHEYPTQAHHNTAGSAAPCKIPVHVR
jgi:hypothetical protein